MGFNIDKLEIPNPPLITDMFMNPDFLKEIEKSASYVPSPTSLFGTIRLRPSSWLPYGTVVCTDGKKVVKIIQISPES